MSDDVVDLARTGRLELIGMVLHLRRKLATRLRSAAVYIESQDAIIASLREQNRQLEEELAAERGVTEELYAEVEDLRAALADEN